MMAEEYRIEILVTVEDQTEPSLRQSGERLNRFVKSALKQNERLRREFARGYRIYLTAIDRARPIIERARTLLRSITGKVWMFTLQAKTTALNVLDRIRNGLFSIQSLAVGVLGIISAGKLWEATVGFAGELEQANIAFATMLGSMEKAQVFLQQMQQFAAKTPFEFPELQAAAKLMLAFGFQADKILPTLTAVGNAAAGLGVGSEGIDRIVRALGQMQAKAKVSAEEMMQLTEVGIPAWDILAKAMGTSTAEVMKLSQRGLIPASKAIDMLVAGMGERFPNMMEKQSRTYHGLMSTIRDNIKMTLGELGRGILTSLEPRLAQIVDWFDKNEETLRRWKDNLVRLGREGAESLLRFFDRAFGKLDRLFSDPKFQKLDFWAKIRVAWDEIATSFNEWVNGPGRPIIEGIGETLSNIIAIGMGNALPILAETAASLGWKVGLAVLEGFGKALQSTPWGAIISGALGGAAIGSVVPGLGTALGALIGAGAGVATWGVTKVTRETREVIRQLPSTLLSAPYTPSIGPSPVLVPAWAEKWRIPGRAVGGIYSRPHLAMVAEAGPEAIIPLSARMRDRALGLWEETGRRLGITPIATPAAAMVGGPGAINTGPISVTSNVTFNITATDGQDVLRVIRAHRKAIADEIAWDIADSVEGAYRNMPRR